MKHIETVVQAENAEYGDRDLPEVDPPPLTSEALAAQLTQWEDRLRPPSLEHRYRPLKRMRSRRVRPIRRERPTETPRP
ncbi:MAG: hypothetical protein OWQ57_04965 [Sulfobacillus sp.]|nr:hypothetical protein [Sulfobacillus sp.]